MPVVDVLVAFVIVAAVVAGMAKGLVRAAPLAGFAVGAVLGSRLPLLIGEDLDWEFSLVAALPGALVVGAILAAIVERQGRRLARFAIRHPRADAVGGAVPAGVAAVVAVWLLAPVATELETAREPVERSHVLSRLNAALQAAGPERPDALPPIDNLPRFAGRGLPSIALGDASILDDPDVRAAERSVVQIRVIACTGLGAGSGWIAADGVVVTNAHVVAAGKVIDVQLRGQGPSLRAVPIWFDGARDLALLRVSRLRGVPALPMVQRPLAGTSGATLGFPLGRRRVARARIGPTTSRLRGRLGGRGSPGVSDDLAGRSVTTIRGLTLPGSSGGPMVDQHGHVLTTVFAGGRTGNRRDGTAASLGVPNRFVRAAVAKAGPRVSTGRCRGERRPVA